MAELDRLNFGTSLICLAPGRALLSLHGGLDLHSAPTARRALVDATAQGFRLLVIDLGELAFMDVAGARLLSDADEQARRQGWRLVVIAGEGPARRVLELLGLLGRLEVLADPAAALIAPPGDRQTASGHRARRGTPAVGGVRGAAGRLVGRWLVVNDRPNPATMVGSAPEPAARG